MYKKAWSTSKVVVLLNKPIVVLTFSLPSASSLLKLPKEASAEERETGTNSKDQVQVTMSTLSTTTVLFRTTFTRTIKLNLLLKWLLVQTFHNERYFVQSMFLVYTIRKTFAPPGKSYRIGALAPPHLQSQGKAPWGRGCSVHTQERLWRRDSVTERSCATLVQRRSRKWSVTYRIGFVPYFGVVWTPIQAVAEVNKLEQNYMNYQRVHSDKPIGGAGSPSCRPGSVRTITTCRKIWNGKLILTPSRWRRKDQFAVSYFFK